MLGSANLMNTRLAGHFHTGSAAADTADIGTDVTGGINVVVDAVVVLCDRCHCLGAKC
jgi:hypothetical protein